MRAISSIVFGALAVSSAQAAAIQKRGSNSWAGTNLYFLQGMSDDDQNTYIGQIKDLGVKVVRVWVNGQGGGCEKGHQLANSCPDLEDSSIGSYNTQTMDLLDSAISKLASSGIKVIISPHDGNDVGDGTSRADIYQNTWGGESFYTNSDAMDAYDKRLAWIVNYQSPSAGKPWKEWTEAIAGFDIQNEPFQFANDLCKGNDQAGWMCGRAQALRSALGDSPIKIGTGGIGGDDSKGCTMMQAALDCDAVDMISVHRYPGGMEGGQNANEWSGELGDYLGKTSKLLYVEEFGAPSDSQDQSQEWPLQTADINKSGVPWMYWQLLPTKNCEYDCGSDCNGIFVDSGIDLGSTIQAASNTAAAQDWSQVLSGTGTTTVPSGGTNNNGNSTMNVKRFLHNPRLKPNSEK